MYIWEFGVQQYGIINKWRKDKKMPHGPLAIHMEKKYKSLSWSVYINKSQMD